jgi:hypothetical protein
MKNPTLPPAKVQAYADTNGLPPPRPMNHANQSQRHVVILGSHSMTTAQIIKLPNAAAVPVVQINNHGRHPKKVTQIREIRYARDALQRDLHVIAEEIEKVNFQLMMNEKMATSWRWHLDKLTRPNMTQVEIKKLSGEIRSTRGLYAELGTIKAANGKP